MTTGGMVATELWLQAEAFYFRLPPWSVNGVIHSCRRISPNIRDTILFRDKKHRCLQHHLGPTWRMCAGMILVAEKCVGRSAIIIENGQALIGGMDVLVCQNYFGSQVWSAFFAMAANASSTMLAGVGVNVGQGCCNFLSASYAWFWCCCGCLGVKVVSGNSV